MGRTKGHELAAMARLYRRVSTARQRRRSRRCDLVLMRRLGGRAVVVLIGGAP